MPHDRDAARVARELIQAAGPPNESNATVSRVVEALTAEYCCSASDLVR
jgi:hypothetical protein